MQQENIQNFLHLSHLHLTGTTAIDEKTPQQTTSDNNETKTIQGE